LTGKLVRILFNLIPLWQDKPVSLHVVTISSEMIPLAKTGGLGDVCGALPIALESIGCRCTAFLPAYRSVLRSGLPIETTNIAFTVNLAGRITACRLLKTKLPHSGVEVFLIDQPQFFERDGLYSDRQGEYRDNCERFSFFCRSTIQAIEALDLNPDIVHCHDWQAGLIPAYMHARLGNFAWMDRARSVMTIHNLAYQGRFWHLDMPLTGLDWSYFNMEQLEYYGDLNLMKSGIVFADRVTTVSPTYAKEIARPEHGCGLDGLLAGRGSELVGIVNGVDYQQWNPATDTNLAQTYDVDTWLTGKPICKANVQAELGLPQSADTPLVGIVSRLAGQKGWDLILPLLRHWLTHRDIQWAILGTGDKNYENELRDMSVAHPTKLAVRLEFSEGVAHRIEAGSDLFLMPSRYEPCGLNQLYSLKYGTVPVVHATGGLADTVNHANNHSLEQHTATGFQFTEYSLTGLEVAINEALDFYLHRRQQWANIVEAGMKGDWSWKNSANRYMEVYLQTLQHRQSLRL
jgi:starch synthase